MTEHHDDIEIDRNLKILCESRNTSEFDLTNFENHFGRKMMSSNESKAFASLMEREELIRVFGDFCALEKFGLEVFNSGGWLKYLSDKEKQDKAQELKIRERENLELDLAKSNLEANKLNKKIAKKNAKNEKFNRISTILNIIIGILNIGLLIWQILKAE